MKKWFFVTLALLALGGFADPARAGGGKGPDSWAQVQNPQGTLFMAVGLTGVDMAQVIDLLKAGAPVNVKDHRGMTPLHYAVLWNDRDLIQILGRRGAWLADAHIAAGLSEIGQLLDFLARDGSLNKPDYFRNTPLHWAAMSGATEAAEVLLQRGAKVNEKNDQGRTPLMLAAAGGHTETVLALLHKKAPVKSTDLNGDTALHSAVRGRNPQVVAALLKSGAKPAAANKRGDTPLALAERLGLKDIAALLKKSKG